MARPTINELRNLGDFVTTYQWRMEIVTSPAALGTINSSNLNLRCQSMACPSASNAKIEVDMRGHKIYQPGPNKYSGSIDLKFIETADNFVQSLITDWRNVCAQVITGAHMTRRDVEATIRLVRLDRQDINLWGYTLFGCFIEDATPGTTDNSQALWMPSIKLSYDYFEDGPAV